MKPVLFQTRKYFNKEIHAFGCAFLSLYFVSDKEYTYSELNAIWDKCKQEGIINSACLIQDWAKLAQALGINASYNGIHAAPTDHIAPNQFALAEYFYKTSHFVYVDRNKKLVYDPIEGGSNTVKNGTIRTLRIFTYVDA